MTNRYDFAMADFSKKLKTNVPGRFFVDSTCIDCDTCRQLAPHIFEEAGEYSAVFAQPTTPEAVQAAYHALLSCPTGSIGQTEENQAHEFMADFPLPIQDSETVYYLGFNSPKSYGGNSYLFTHPEGNWMIDSPKFLPHLVEKINALGGLKYVFLTHRDDVAEAQRYAEAFGATRIIHEADLKAQPNAEWVLQGNDPISAAGSDVLMIPTPGHSAGHVCLLYQQKYLFTGDHLSWSRKRETLSAYRDYCWHSWEEQIQSMERLFQHPFQWILPGHGQRVQLTAKQRQTLEPTLLNWMKAVT